MFIYFETENNKEVTDVLKHAHQMHSYKKKASIHAKQLFKSLQIMVRRISIPLKISSYLTIQSKRNPFKHINALKLPPVYNVQSLLTSR